MAITTVIQTVVETARQLVLHVAGVQNTSAADQSLLVIADKSTYVLGGPEAAHLDVERIRWCSQGFTYIRLDWDHAVNDLIMALNGSGAEDFAGAGELTGFDSTGGLKDPETADETGDILLTTVGGAANATYDITLWLRKR